jgi:hypothetical protein
MLIFKELIYNGVRSGQIPARSRASRTWYRDAAQQVTGKFQPSKVVRQFPEKKRVARPEPGYMYSFKYDPKHKKTLPYYDVFPLVFPVQQYSDGFLGINFHYLPLPLRAKLMDALYTVASDKRYNEETRILVSYDILKSASKFAMFKPTTKRYLYQHVKTPFLEITAAEWDIALFLPMESFKGASASEVWKDSRGKI